MSRRSTRYNKRDANEMLLINTLNDLGSIWIEGGDLDGFAWLGQWVPVEIKTKEGRLTKGQQAFIDSCEHFNRPYRIWRTTSDVIKDVQEWRSK